MDLLERRRIILPNSENLLYDRSNLVCDGSNYFDTGFAPFSATNYNRDFKIVIKFAEIPTQSTAQAVYLGCKYEGTLNGQSYPGFYIRRTTSTTNVDIGGYSYYTPSAASLVNKDIIFWRRNHTYYVKVGSATPVQLNVRETQFDQNIVIGAGVQTNGTKFRYGICTFDYFRIEYI